MPWGAAGRARGEPLPPRAKARSLPHPAAPHPDPAVPAQRTGPRKPGCDLELRPPRDCPRPHLTRRQGGERPEEPSALPPGAHGPKPPHSARPRQVRDHLRAPGTTRAGAPDHGAHDLISPGWGSQCIATSHEAEVPVHHRNPALFLEKPPPPLSSNTLTCVSAQCFALLAAVPGHVHARARCRARLVPLGSRRPQPARAHTRGGATSGGAQFPDSQPPGAELEELPVHHLRRPHQRSRPEPGRGLPPRRGRPAAHAAAAAHRPQPRRPKPTHGPARRARPHPTPPALACCDSALQLRAAAPPAVTPAAEDSLRAGSAERRWWRRRRPQF